MKKIILAVAVVATAAIAGWNYQQNQDKVEMSDLTMDNIEALASNENSPHGTLYGNSSGTRYCCCPGSSSCGAADCSGC